MRYLAVKIGYYERETLVESSSTFASQSRRVHNGLLLIYLRAPSLHFSSSFRPSSCYLRPCRGRWVVHEGSRGGRTVGEHGTVPHRNSAYPAYRTDSRNSGKKKYPPYSCSSFFLSRISRKVSVREREKARRAAVKYFVVTELDTERRALFFHDWSFISFVDKYYYYISIFLVILR